MFLLFVAIAIIIVIVVVVIIFVLVVILVLLCWGESSLACRRERALTSPATLQINTQQKTQKTKDAQNIKHIKRTNYQNNLHKTNTRKYTKHDNLIDKHTSVNKFLKSNRTRIKKEEWSVKSNTNWKKRKRIEKKRRKKKSNPPEPTNQRGWD